MGWKARESEGDSLCEAKAADFIGKYAGSPAGYR